MNSRKEAYIGQASENDLRIALSYRCAFEVLYNSDRYQDQIVMPALFMVRQFLELGLKYNIKQLSSISGSLNLLNDLSNTHDLKKLHCSFLDHYYNAKKKLGIKNARDGKLLDDLTSLVDLIALFDNNSMGFRYAKDKDGKTQITSEESYNLKSIYPLLKNVSTLLSYTDDIFGLIPS